jgi:radical SAM protein with 4Fe4S-binding SPASM domain
VTYRDSESGLQILELELTNRCNLACRHCYVDKAHPSDLGDDKTLHLIEEANELGVNRLVLTGGEPLLLPALHRFGGLARDLGIPDVALMTNGLLITENNIEQLSAFNIVQMSLELTGPSGPRMRPNYRKHLEKKIRILQSHGITPYLFATLHKGSLPQLKEMILLADSMGVHLGFNKLIPIADKPFLQDQKLSHAEYKWALGTLIEFAQEGFSVSCSDPLLFLLDDRKLRRLMSEDDGRICGGCIAGIAALYISVSGEAYPCPFVRATCGNIHESRLGELWERSEVLQRFRARSEFSGPCGSCRHRNYCGGCRGASHARYGTYFGSDPNCFRSSG